MFSMLPSPFNGFGVNANATILSTNAGVNSSGTAATGANEFGLTGLGDYQNITLIYQKYGLGVRVTYSHRGKYIYQIGDGINALAPVYVRGYGELDAQVSYKLNRHIIIALSGSNMTNSAQQWYDTRPDEFYNFVKYGPRYELSIRAEY
jgi:outer membrane receptor for monomeric catechols